MSPKSSLTAPVPLKDIWRPANFHSTVQVVIPIGVLVLWLYIVYSLYWALVTARGPFVPGYGFLSYFVLVATYPVIFLVNQIFTASTCACAGRLTGVDPYYGFCTIGPDSLTARELGFGAVGAIDYKCHNEQYSLTSSQADTLISNTYYVVYALFTLVLFFFTQSAGRFKNVVANKNSVFITAVIRYALILSLIVMGSTVFKGYYYASLIVNSMFFDILQLIGALMVMLISHILYRLTFIYK